MRRLRARKAFGPAQTSPVMHRVRCTPRKGSEGFGTGQMVPRMRLASGPTDAGARRVDGSQALGLGLDLPQLVSIETVKSIGMSWSRQNCSISPPHSTALSDPGA